MALPGVLARQELVGVDSDLMNDVRSLERLTLNAAIGAVDLRTLSRRRVALQAGTRCGLEAWDGLPLRLGRHASRGVILMIVWS